MYYPVTLYQPKQYTTVIPGILRLRTGDMLEQSLALDRLLDGMPTVENAPRIGSVQACVRMDLVEVLLCIHLTRTTDPGWCACVLKRVFWKTA